MRDDAGPDTRSIAPWQISGTLEVMEELCSKAADTVMDMFGIAAGVEELWKVAR